jgi:Domain of unknown function (DUF4157)
LTLNLIDMSYSTRVYRQRNAHVFDNDASKEQSSFFTKSKEQSASKGGKPTFFQTKLSIGQPNDAYEKEADAVASAVVNHQPGNAPVVQQKKISSIQRLATPLEEEKTSTNDERMKKDKEIQEKPEIQMMCPGCEKEQEEKKGAVQTKSDGGGTASPQLSAKIEGSAGKGRGLPKKALSEMGNSFGVDFSNVNIHTDSEAVQMNKQLGSQAFTHGSDIYFNSGKYNTDTFGGKQLLAHELTHVIQQNSENNIQRSMVPNIQPACEDKSFKNCGGACTHPTSGNAGTCRWTGLTNGCKCFENPRSGRSLMEVLPYWIIAALSAAALAALIACFATGVCEAAIIIGLAGAAVGAVIIGIFRSAGVQVNEEETA